MQLDRARLEEEARMEQRRARLTFSPGVMHHSEREHEIECVIVNEGRSAAYDVGVVLVDADGNYRTREVAVAPILNPGRRAPAPAVSVPRTGEPQTLHARLLA